MGWRYRKSIKICSGVRLNLGSKNISLTFGRKGLHTTINSKGDVTNSFGIPSTGLYYSKRTRLPKSNDGVKTQIQHRNINTTSAQNGITEYITKIKNSKTIKIDWDRINNTPLTATSSDSFQWLKSKVKAIISKDFTSYNEVISYMEKQSIYKDVDNNEIDIFVIDGNTLSVHFIVDNYYLNLASQLQSKIRNYLLLQYVTTVSLRLGKVFFSLLPVTNIFVDCECDNIDVSSVNLNRTAVLNMDFLSEDSIKLFQGFQYQLNWTVEKGFSPIIFLDESYMV